MLCILKDWKGYVWFVCLLYLCCRVIEKRNERSVTLKGMETIRRIQWDWKFGNIFAIDRLLRFVTLVHLPFSVGSLDLFIISLVFTKGTSCLSKANREPTRYTNTWQITEVSNSTKRQFDTSVICYVLVYRVGSRFAFERYDVYCERAAYLHVTPVRQAVIRTVSKYRR